MENPIVSLETNNEQPPEPVDKDEFPVLEGRKSRKRYRTKNHLWKNAPFVARKDLQKKGTRIIAHCSCGEIYCKCSCGQWHELSKLNEDPNCNVSKSRIVMCGSTCGFYIL